MATDREHLIVTMMGRPSLEVGNSPTVLATARSLGMTVKGTTVTAAPSRFLAKWTPTAAARIDKVRAVVLRKLVTAPIDADDIYTMFPTVEREHLDAAMSSLVADGLVDVSDGTTVRLIDGLAATVATYLPAPVKASPVTKPVTEVKVAAPEEKVEPPKPPVVIVPTAVPPPTAVTEVKTVTETETAIPVPETEIKPEIKPETPKPVTPVTIPDALATSIAAVAVDMTATKEMVNRIGELVVEAQRSGSRVRIVASRETTVEQVAQRVAVLLHVHGRMTKSEIRNDGLSSGQRAKLEAALELGLTSGAFKRELGSRLSLQNPEPLGLEWNTLDETRDRLLSKKQRREHVPCVG